MEETILTANALKFRYDPEQPIYALNGVSVGVRRGEFVAVLGANGCGKSTLAKHFNAILLPESGTVLVEGMDTRDEEKIYDIRQKVGMVFQSPDNQIVATVVEEDVAFALENLGVPPEEMRRRVDDAMKMAGIYEYRERAPHNLSGGQKQRVAIAGVVAMRPDCLILDEATAMLDPRGREQVMQTIHRLNKDLGITVVAITHYMEEAAQADRVLVMSQGHVVMEGTPKEVFSQTEKVRALRLDVPQAAELRDELVKAGIPMPEGIIDTGECAQALYELLQYRRADAMGSIIKVEHLSYVNNPGMPNAVTALDDVSFEVEEGDFVGIIGATGSGKSTLITHMNGLNKPTSGKIFIDGRDLWAEPEKIRDFRFLTGLVFQYPEYQLFEETCYKDIAFGPKNMGLDEAEIDRRVHEAASFVGLDEALLERSPFELSGGQKRRVAVAGVMAMKPRILVLDEPAAGLDPEGRDEILSEVKNYHKKTGTTVLLVSHSMEDIAKYADRVLVMSNKKIAMYDTVEQVFARAPELLALGLSVPQVTKIFLKLREMGVDVPADVYTVPYAVKMILEAKQRRDAGESLVLPREQSRKGGVSEC